MTSERLSIGIITQAYYPIHGGVSEHVDSTAKELVRRGHDVHIITAYFDRGDEHWNWGGRVHRIGRDITIPVNGAFVNVTFATDLGKHLARLERRFRFDVVHIHQPWDPFLPLSACRNICAPKVGTFHSYQAGGRSVILDVLQSPMRDYVSALDVRVAVSKAARRFTSRYVHGDFRIIPNGVALDRFRPDSAPIPGLDDGKKNVLFVGRMDPRKGIKYLLKAWPAIASAVPDARLVIVGGGVLGEYYRRVYVRDGSRIRWEGYVSNEDLPRYFRSAHVYCAPSIRGESFGIVLLEAMASGAPVVTFNIPGYTEVVRDEQEALIVPNRDAHALGNAVIRLLCDEQLRLRLRDNGLTRAAEYAWPRITDQLEDAYREAIIRHSRAS